MIKKKDILVAAVIVAAAAIIVAVAAWGGFSGESEEQTTQAQTAIDSQASSSEELSVTELLTAVVETIKTTVQTTAEEIKSSTGSSTKQNARTTTAPATEKTTKKKPAESATKASNTYDNDRDYSCFDDCAFVGNSRVETIREYGILPNAAIFAKVGLDIRTVYTKSLQGSSVPVIDELNSGSYSKVFLMFGDNEIGWPYLNVFIEEYGRLVDEVAKRQPRAEIYLQSILPISASASRKKVDGLTNEKIDELNAMIKQLAADKGVHYINPAQAFKDSEGCLPESAASDGIHFGKKYCYIWLDYLKEHMED